MVFCAVFISISTSYAISENETVNKLDIGYSNVSNKILSVNITGTKVVNPPTSPVTSSSYTTTKKPSKLSQSSIIEAAKYIDNYAYKYGKLPNNVKISGYTFSIPEFTYLVSKTIQYKYRGNNLPIAVKYGVKDPTNVRGVKILGDLDSKKIYSYCGEVISYINYYNVAPNLVETSLGSIPYQSMVYVFVKIVVAEELPEKVSLDIEYSNPLLKSIPKYVYPGTKNILNNKYTKGSLRKYLIPSKKCPSNSIYIKKLANKITAGSKTKLQKATAIYNWVRDNIEYYFYYNTRHGAKNAIIKKRGNCVDQSHVIVALARASKLPARYVQGNCKFVSGNWYGHAWTQILVGKNWIVADASNFELNGFGVVNNWKANSYKLKGKYNQIYF